MSNTALYIIENNVNAWLKEQDEQEELGVIRADTYRRRGIPGKGIRLVDQLLYNHNYYAIQFSNLAIKYLHFETDDSQTVESIEKVACLLLGRHPDWTARLSEYDARSKRDWMQITHTFQEGGRDWDGIYLPQHLDITRISKDIELLHDPVALELWNHAKEHFEKENEFYYLLRKKRFDRTYLDPRHLSSATWPLACYRALIPYWVDREAYVPSFSKTIYTSEFWSSYKHFNQMAEDLSNCYSDAFGITPAQADDYKKNIIKFHDKLVSLEGECEVESNNNYSNLNDKIFSVEQFWKDGEIVENRILAPSDSFLARKSKLISAVLCPAFMGDLALLGFDERFVNTLTFTNEYEQYCAEDSIQGDWGELSISIQIASDPAPVSMSVNLDGSKSDGPVLILGRSHGGFWESWTSELIEAVKSFFEKQRHIATGESLLGNMINAAIMKAINKYEKQYEIFGLNDTPIENVSYCFLSKLASFLKECGNCYARDTRSADEKHAFLPAIGHITQKVLEEINQNNQDIGLFGSHKSHIQMVGQIEKNTKSAAISFLNIVRGLNDNTSPIIKIIEEKIKEFELNNAEDPSAKYFFGGVRCKDGSTDFLGLRQRLTENLRKKGTISLDQLVLIIESTIKEYSDYEHERYTAIVDAQISRRHAMFLLKNDVLQLIDLGSKNGTALKRPTEELAQTVLFHETSENQNTQNSCIKNATWVSADARPTRCIPINHGDTIYLAGAAALHIQ